MTGRKSRSRGGGVLETEDSMCKGPEVAESMMLSLLGEMNNRLVPNRKRSSSRLHIVTLLI